VSGSQSRSQWRHRPEGDGVGGHYLATGLGSSLIVTKVRNNCQVLAWGLLVDAAFVLDPVVAIGKHLLAGFGSTWTSNSDTICGRGCSGGSCSCGGCSCCCSGGSGWKGFCYNLTIKSFASVCIIVGLEQHLNVCGVGEVRLVTETVSLTRLSQLPILIIKPQKVSCTEISRIGCSSKIHVRTRELELSSTCRFKVVCALLEVGIVGGVVGRLEHPSLSNVEDDGVQGDSIRSA